MLYETSLKEARSHFSSLLDKAENGEVTIITRHGKKVARLIPEKKHVAKPSLFPNLKSFRSQIKTKGLPLSQTVSKMRSEERY